MTGMDAFTSSRPLVLVGAGKMGSALLAGWLARGLDPATAVVVDPSPSPDAQEMLRAAGIAVSASVPSAVAARAIVVAVKPQIMGSVLPALRPLLARDTVALSIAAGTTVASLEAGLGPVTIVRSMPNTPAQVGRGVSAAFANARAGATAKALVTGLLDAVGKVVWVDDERLIDAVTAVSGSGPAYVFYMVECLAAAARSVGLPDAMAMELARATVEGAGELLYQSDLPAEQLRKNVTSPGGTTAAALAVLMADDGLAGLMERAVKAARKRSEELSG